MKIQNINDLNSKDLIFIFKKIDNILQNEETLRILSLVNKKFRKIAIAIKSKRDIKGIIYPLNSIKDLSRLFMRSLFREFYLSSIKSIKINFNINSNNLCSILENNLYLTHLEISEKNGGSLSCNSETEFQSFINVLFKLKQIETLIIDFDQDFDPNFFTDAFFILLSENCKQLKNISINKSSCTDEGFLHLSKLKLQSLTLQRSKIKNPNFSIPSLKFLNLSHNKYLTASFHPSLSHSSNLESLYLINFTDNLQRLLQYVPLPRLKELNLYCNNKYDLFNVININELTSLKRLFVNENQVINNLPELNNLYLFKNLEYLGIKVYCQESFLPIVNYFSNIKTLEFFNSNISTEFNEEINVSNLIFKKVNFYETKTTKNVNIVHNNVKKIEFLDSYNYRNFLATTPNVETCIFSEDIDEISHDVLKEIASYKSLSLLIFNANNFYKKITFSGPSEINAFKDSIFFISLSPSIKIPNLFIYANESIEEDKILEEFNNKNFNYKELILIANYAIKNKYINLINLIKEKFNQIIPLEKIELIFDHVDYLDIILEIIDYKLLSKRFTLLELLNIDVEIFELLIHDQIEYFKNFDLEKLLENILEGHSSKFINKDLHLSFIFKNLEKISIDNPDIAIHINSKIKAIFSFNTFEILLEKLEFIQANFEGSFLYYLEFFLVNSNLDLIKYIFKNSIYVSRFLSKLSNETLTLFKNDDYRIENLNPLILFFVPYIDHSIIKNLEMRKFNFNFSSSLLFKAMEQDNNILFNYLITKSPTIVSKKYLGTTIFHKALIYRDDYYIRLLLPIADVTILESNSLWSPLHYACSDKQTWQYIPDLIERKINISSKDSNGNSPLHILVSASFSNEIFTYIELLNTKENHTFNNEHMSPFFYACNRWNNYEAIKNFYKISKEYIIRENNLGNVALYYFRKNEKLNTIDEFFYEDIFHVNKRGNFSHFPLSIKLKDSFNLFPNLQKNYLNKHNKIEKYVYIAPELLFEYCPFNSETYNEYLYFFFINYNFSFFIQTVETKYTKEFYLKFLKTMTNHSASLKKLTSYFMLPVFFKNLNKSKIFHDISISPHKYVNDETLFKIIEFLPKNADFEIHKKNIETIFDCIKNKKFYIGTPNAKNIEQPTYEELKRLYLFYDDLENLLNHFLHYILDKKEIGNYLILLSEWGSFCATRWKNELEQFYNSYISEIKTEINIPYLIQKLLYEIKLEIIYEMSGNDTHDINEIKFLIGEFIGIDKGYVDPIKISERNYGKLIKFRKRCLDEFLNRYHTVLISSRLLNYVDELLKNDIYSSMMLNYLKEKIAPSYDEEKYSKMKAQSLLITENEEEIFRKKYDLLVFSNMSLEDAIKEDQFENFIDVFINNESYKKLVIRTILLKEEIVRDIFTNHKEDWKLKKLCLSSNISLGLKRNNPYKLCSESKKAKIA